MAAPQKCDIHPDQPALLIIHNLEQAEFQGVCPECMTGFALAWLQTVAPEMIAKPAAKPRGKKAAPPAAPVADDQGEGESDASGSQATAGQAAG